MKTILVKISSAIKLKKKFMYCVKQIPFKQIPLMLKGKTLILFLLLVASHTIFAQTQNRIKIVRVATVDINKIIKFIKTNGDIERALRVRKPEEQIRIDELIAEISDARLYLQDNIDLLEKSKVAEIEEEILFKEKEIATLERSVDLKNKSISKVSPAAIRGLYQIIKKEAQVKGFSMVLEKGSAVIYVDDDLDLTLTIISKLGEMKKK